MAQLEVQRITHVFESPTLEALRDVSLSVRKGEFACLVGPSGCGKTTLVRIIAGLLPPTSGEVLLKGKKASVVFQEDSLFPWLSLRQNVEFVLQDRPEKEREQEALSLLQLVGLREFASFYPRDVSLGMKQRASLARALASEPSVLLLDEPFASLDAKTREDSQVLLQRVLEEKNCTALLVTHNLEEAVFLSDCIYVLSRSPGSVKKKFSNSIPRPRLPHLKKSKDFLALELGLLRHLKEV